MNEKIKKQLLNDCNRTPLENFVEYIKNGDITWEELDNNGLSDQNKIELKKLLDIPEMKNNIGSIFDDEDEVEDSDITSITNISNQEQQNYLTKDIIDDLTNLSADEIRTRYQQGIISLEDLNIPSFSQRRIDALKYYCNRNQITPPMYKLSDLDELRKESTDVYFVGLSRTGKSSILSSILLTSNNEAIIHNDVNSNPKGVAMQNLYTEDLDLGIIPDPTSEDSFNYLPANLRDINEIPHPLNFIEMPGELWRQVKEEPDKKEELLKYLQNDNKKILIFVIDVTYKRNSNPPQTKMKQRNAYTQFLSMFDEMDVLKQTYAIYFVLNKIDIVGDNAFDISIDSRNAETIFKEDFLNLLKTAKSYKSEIADKIKLKLFPFTLGKVVNVKIVEEFKKEYAISLINELINDSFYIKKSFFNKFF